MTLPTAKSNCWTCKERKVGCDRTLPACMNCTRAKRECKGYGLKLAWPDKHDGRRKQKKYEADPNVRATNYVTNSGEFYFLNTGMEDIEGRRYTMRDLVEKFPLVDFWAQANGPQSPNLWNRNLGERDGTLLSYYETVVARVITTVDDSTNGFRLQLVPMALTSTDLSATSLLQAMLAVAAFHLGSWDEALGHKVRAIEALSHSFSEECFLDEKTRLAQFAACMMLCTYSVFDASDTSWYTHLQGARKLVLAYREIVPGHLQKCDPFLQEWYEYHHTLSEYTYPFEFCTASPSVHDILVPHSPVTERRILAPQSPIQSDTDTDIRIIGVFGCSAELLQIISCINQLRTLLTIEACCPESELLDLATRLRTRLLNIHQEVPIYVDQYTGQVLHTRIRQTAELYRIAAILYLYNTYPGVAPNPSSNGLPKSTSPLPTIPALVSQSFSCLRLIMNVCTSPWPLFLIACNATEDQDRMEIMMAIEKGFKERRIGNYKVILGLVKTFWKRADLNNDEGRDGSTRLPDWKTLVDADLGMPSFG